MSHQRDTGPATAARIKKAKKMRDNILERLNYYPGLSTYDLSTYLLTSPGTIFKSIEKLQNNGHDIQIKEALRGGQKVKLYSIKQSSLEDTSRSTYYPINKNEIKKSEHNDSIWKGIGVAYLNFDDKKILIYPRKRPTLEAQYFSTNLTVRDEQGNLVILFTEKIINACKLQSQTISHELKKDHIVLSYEEKQYELKEIGKKKILIIDDNNNNTIKNIMGHLEDKNHKVLYVESEKIGLNKIKSQFFDFIILDWTEGINEIKHFKLMDELHKKNPHARAVIITGEVYDRQDVLDYTKKGIVWFYAKIVDNLPQKIENDMRAVLKK